jgi:hypothetical protein
VFVSLSWSSLVFRAPAAGAACQPVPALGLAVGSTVVMGVVAS